MPLDLTATFPLARQVEATSQAKHLSIGIAVILIDRLEETNAQLRLYLKPGDTATRHVIRDNERAFRQVRSYFK